MFKNPSVQFVAFLQATGFISYLIVLSTIFNFVLPNIDKPEVQFYAPIIMLTLFVTSAVISGLLILGKAGTLFWDKNYKEAFILIGWTLGWLVFYSTCFLFILSRS